MKDIIQALVDEIAPNLSLNPDERIPWKALEAFVLVHPAILDRSYRQAAAILGVSINTISNHIQNLHKRWPDMVNRMLTCRTEKRECKKPPLSINDSSFDESKVVFRF